MLHRPILSDYGLGTGINQSVRDLTDPALRSVGRDWRYDVAVEPTSARRAEGAKLLADRGPAYQEVGRDSRTSSQPVLREMLDLSGQPKSFDSGRCTTSRRRAAATNTALVSFQARGYVTDSAPGSTWTERAKTGERPNLARMSAVLYGLRNRVPGLARIAPRYASGRRVPKFEATGPQNTESETEPGQRPSPPLPSAPGPTSRRSGPLDVRATFCGCRRSIEGTYGTAPTGPVRLDLERPADRTPNGGSLNFLHLSPVRPGRIRIVEAEQDMVNPLTSHRVPVTASAESNLSRRLQLQRCPVPPIVAAADLAADTVSAPTDVGTASTRASSKAPI